MEYFPRHPRQRGSERHAIELQTPLHWHRHLHRHDGRAPGRQSLHPLLNQPTVINRRGSPQDRRFRRGGRRPLIVRGDPTAHQDRYFIGSPKYMSPPGDRSSSARRSTSAPHLLRGCHDVRNAYGQPALFPAADHCRSCIITCNGKARLPHDLNPSLPPGPSDPDHEAMSGRQTKRFQTWSELTRRSSVSSATAFKAVVAEGAGGLRLSKVRVIKVQIFRPARCTGTPRIV